jgi:hypothetical protein
MGSSSPCRSCRCQQLDAERRVDDFLADLIAAEQRRHHSRRRLHVRQDGLALVRFEDRLDDGQVGRGSDVQIGSVAVLNHGEEQRGGVLDLDDPGPLAEGVRHAGQEHRAALLAQQQL